MLWLVLIVMTILILNMHNDLAFLHYSIKSKFKELK